MAIATMNKETVSFLTDLKSVCDKHSVFPTADAEYDGDGYIGTTYRFRSLFDKDAGMSLIFIDIAEVNKFL